MKTRYCPNHSGNIALMNLDLPALGDASENPLMQCDSCGKLFRVNPVTEQVEDVTHFFEMLLQGDDRLHMAVSDGHEVKTASVFDTLTRWRAASEMETLSAIGEIQQTLAILDNRLHSLKKRFAAAMLGEPQPLDIEEMLRLVDECIDLASPSPPKERGVRKTR